MQRLMLFVIVYISVVPSTLASPVNASNLFTPSDIAASSFGKEGCTSEYPTSVTGHRVSVDQDLEQHLQLLTSEEDLSQLSLTRSFEDIVKAGLLSYESGVFHNLWPTATATNLGLYQIWGYGPNNQNFSAAEQIKDIIIAFKIPAPVPRFERANSARIRYNGTDWVFNGLWKDDRDLNNYESFDFGEMRITEQELLEDFRVRGYAGPWNRIEIFEYVNIGQHTMVAGRRQVDGYFYVWELDGDRIPDSRLNPPTCETS